jgi:hypothetical protein
MDLVLNAGLRNFRGKQRLCLLLFHQTRDAPPTVRLLLGEPPADVPEIRITFESFLALKRQFGLAYRTRRSPAERAKLRQQSLQKYRKSPKYQQARQERLQRERKDSHTLTQEAIREIRSRKLAPAAYARRHRISLREVAMLQEVLHGDT